MWQIRCETELLSDLTSEDPINESQVKNKNTKAAKINEVGVSYYKKRSGYCKFIVSGDKEI